MEEAQYQLIEKEINNKIEGVQSLLWYSKIQAFKTLINNSNDKEFVENYKNYKKECENRNEHQSNELIKMESKIYNASLQKYNYSKPGTTKEVFVKHKFKFRNDKCSTITAEEIIANSKQTEREIREMTTTDSDRRMIR